MPEPNRDHTQYETVTPALRLDFNKMTTANNPANGHPQLYQGWAYFDSTINGLAYYNGAVFRQPGAAAHWENL